MKKFGVILLCAQVSNAFVIVSRSPAAVRTVRAAGLENLEDIGYRATIAKPLGVVFGENRAPFSGLSVDEVSDGLNGDSSGMRIGDQLLAVNGQSVIGAAFDSAMTLLRNAESPMELRLYRGTISSLFTIVMNRRGEDFFTADENDDIDEVIFDETYESPVVVSLDDYVGDEDSNFSISELAGGAAKNIGTMFSGMFSKETIQLDDKDGK